MRKVMQATLACAALALLPSTGNAQEAVTNLKVKRVNPPADIFATMRQFDAGQMMGGGATADLLFVPDSLAGGRFLPPALQPIQRAVKLRERLL